MDLRSRLKVIYSDGVTEVDYSSDAQNFKFDPFNITLLSTDFIYVGYHKIINALYFQLNTPQVTPSSLNLEYYSLTGWKALDISDDTRAFTRSGFIHWERPEDAAPLEVANMEACWVRISSNDSLAVASFQAINIVFSDDKDLANEVPALIDVCFYQQGQNSHILHHVAAKSYIMGRLKSLGYVKNTNTGEENINEWDVLDVFELRNASTYYTLSQIYFNLSDTPDDQYWTKYKAYENKFEEAFGLGRLRIDINDNGQVDLNEKRQVKSLRWTR